MCKGPIYISYREGLKLKKTPDLRKVKECGTIAFSLNMRSTKNPLRPIAKNHCDVFFPQLYISVNKKVIKYNPWQFENEEYKLKKKIAFSNILVVRFRELVYIDKKECNNQN